MVDEKSPLLIDPANLACFGAKWANKRRKLVLSLFSSTISLVVEISAVKVYF